jgi:DNA-damage-inducible protein D
MEELQIPDEGNNLSFEDFKNENGMTFWWASDLMIMLGYKEMKSFQKVLDRATKAFVSLNIPHYENIISYQREDNGISSQDFKLSRFACYLVVINGDPKKKQVAEAQGYFAQQTRKFELLVQGQNEIERILIRDELIEGNKSLASIGKQAGGTGFDYAKFQNAGYLGMYNMPSWKLEKKRGVKKGTLMEFMGRTELAANLFRVTQTEERIKNSGIRGQSKLEQTHFEVGKEVRNMVEKNVGRSPENLIQEEQLSVLKKSFKRGHKQMLSEDKSKKKPS